MSNFVDKLKMLEISIHETRKRIDRGEEPTKNSIILSKLQVIKQILLYEYYKSTKDRKEVNK